MKLLTLNFLTCAIKTCKTNPASFPLHPRDAELEIVEADINLPFLKNIVPRLMWVEFRALCSEVRTFCREETEMHVLGHDSTDYRHSSVSQIFLHPLPHQPILLSPQILPSVRPKHCQLQRTLSRQMRRLARQPRTCTKYFWRRAYKRAS